MFRKSATLLILCSVGAASVFAQGLNTRASKDDWEEINFEFNSSVLSDGYPSLLRLAELLSKNPGYHVRVEGHTDNIGSARYNEKLGLARADTVRDFLVKYGAKADQIQTSTRGKSEPEAGDAKRRYSKTDVARWMNRRVVLTVTDEGGKTVSAGSIGDAIRSMDQGKLEKMQQCCDEILKRLDRLDEIAKMLKDMADQNASLRKEVDDLKAQQAASQSALQSQINALPKPLSEEQTSQLVDTRLEKFRDPRFSLLGLNVGSDDQRNLTFSGRGRFFAPFKDHVAIQAQGEYMYFKAMKEGQFDLGLVDRIGNFQGGLFTSFKHVSLSGMQNGGTLGQAALTLDYIMRLGRIGVFGTKGFLNDAVVNRANYQFASGTNPDGTVRMTVAPNVFVETYLRTIDQVGVSTSVALWGNNYLEANVGYLKSYAHADRPGGTVRFVFPVHNLFAFTVEGGINETLLAANNWGRATVGIQFGNFIRPKEMQAMTHPVPADVPRVRWEMLTRRVQSGATQPVADAGPDQIGIAPGTVQLNGSNSYDPNGETLTYAWTQEAGPSVALSGANTATPSFTATAGHSYAFRLTVTNTSGLSSSARVRISTRSEEKAQILFFIANPATINAGQASTLSWKVLNATDVTISGIGPVAAEGNTSVAPTQTTTYQLTATNAVNQVNQTVTVTVNSALPRVFGCSATPSSIASGGNATIAYQTENATSISVSPSVSGSLPPGGGTFTVNPTTNTTYVITATSASGQTATCSVPVVVTTVAQPPQISNCVANPATISAGGTSTISFQTQNTTSVAVSPAVSGNIPAGGGSFSVTPTATTTYTLTASGQGTQTSTCTVMVTVGTPPPTITAFTATPSTSPSPGSPVLLTCTANNATTVSVSPGGPLSSNGTVTVNPMSDTTYTCTATGAGGSVSQALTVKVTPQAQGLNVIVAGAPLFVSPTRVATLNASLSTGNGPLTYQWTSANPDSVIQNPTAAITSVILPERFGDYQFTVTVTDAAGHTASGNVTVRLAVLHIP